ncbi:hypothetical protein Tco_1554263 [Tanacetum coccineum]
MGNKPLPISFLGSGLVFLLHNGLPLSSSSGLAVRLSSGLPSEAGKENWVNILKSIDEGPFQMGTFQETLAEGNEGALHLGPERARVYSDLSPEDKERYNANIRATNILLQRFPKDIYTLINHYIDAKDIWDNVKMILEGSELTKEDRESQLYNDFEHFCQNKGETIHDYYVRFVTAVKLNRGLKESNYDQLVDKIEVRGTIQEAQVQLVMEGLKTELGMQILVKLDILSVITAMENGVVLDEEQLLFLAGSHDTAADEDVYESPVQDLALNVDNMFQADECDAFDSDVDEAPTTQTMFMANLSSADPVYDEAAHEMHHYVQPNYVVDSNADYMSDINMISYDQYVKGNAEPVVQSNVSSLPNDAYMTIINEMHKQTAQSVYVNEQNKVVNASLTIELANIRNKLNWLTEGERGFEQTKECYLTKVIPFFKTLKEHFEGIKKALTKEIKEMKEIFEELEAEVDQNVVNRKYDEIEQKNLFIANDNLIADCLSKEVFYIATNSELILSRLTEMHDAHTIVHARCLELEAKLSKLHDKVQKDNHTELVKCFSNLKITRAKHIEQTIALLTENENLKAQIHENLKCITMDSVKLRVLALGRYAIDVEPIPPRSRNNMEVHLDYLKHLKESVETLREIVEEAKVERPLGKVLTNVGYQWKPTGRIFTLEKLCPLIRLTTSNVLPVQQTENYKAIPTSIPTPTMNKEIDTSMPTDVAYANQRDPNKNWGSNFPNSPSLSVFKCRTVRFGNDHFGAIMGYGDYVIGNNVISRVYYVEGLGRNLFFVRQFYYSYIEVAFRKHSCYVRDTDGAELIKGSRGSNLYTISIEDIMKSSSI